MSNEEISESDNKKRVKKNFFIISITLILVYTCFDAVTNLQSSINIDQNIGLYSLAIIAGCAGLSSLFITNPMIYFLGYKWTIFLSQIGFGIFIAANIYPKAWLMYSASAICGLLQGGFWTSHSAYIADLGKTSETANGAADANVNKCFGFFFAAHQMTQIFGNLITYLVLRNTKNTFKQTNTDLCGANYLEHQQNSTQNDESEISTKTSSILFGIFVGLIVISLILVALFLDQKQHNRKSQAQGAIKDTMKYIGETLKQLKKPKQLLILPLPFCIAASEAFIFGTFTSSFVTCTIGIQYIGLVMLTFGISAMIFDIIIGYLGKFHCRSLLLTIAALMCYAMLITMLLWKPQPSQTYVLYLLAGLFGLAQAIWDPTVAALYEKLFRNNEEAAFSIMWLGQDMAYLVVYLYAEFIRVRTSIILQIVYVTIAWIGYFILQIVLFYEQRKHSDELRIELTVHDDE